MNNIPKTTMVARSTHFNCASHLRCCSSSAMNHIGTEASAIGRSSNCNQSQTVSLVLNPVHIYIHQTWHDSNDSKSRKDACYPTTDNGELRRNEACYQT